MAKVMISIPDKLLSRLDARARETGESRSGFLQRLAEREVAAAEDRKRSEVKDLLREIVALEPGEEPRVSAAQLIREDRDSR